MVLCTRESYLLITHVECENPQIEDIYIVEQFECEHHLDLPSPVQVTWHLIWRTVGGSNDTPSYRTRSVDLLVGDVVYCKHVYHWYLNRCHIGVSDLKHTVTTVFILKNLLFFIWHTLFLTFIKCVWICHNLWKYLYPHIIITRSMKSIHVPHRQKWHTRCFILLKTILKPTFNHPSCPWLFKPIKKNLKYFYQGVKADCVYNACAIILTDDGGSLYENQTVWILWLHHFCKF